MKLAPQFVIALALLSCCYQALYTGHVWRALTGPQHRARTPFVLNNALRAVRLEPEAEEAGLKKGDLIQRIQGSPVPGLAAYLDAVEATAPGVRLSVSANGRDVAIALRPTRAEPHPLGTIVLSLLLYVVTPWLCLGFGLLALFLRPSLPLVWLLFAVLAGTAQINELSGWSLPLRGFATLYRLQAETLIPLWLMLLGLHFPSTLQTRWLSRCVHAAAGVLAINAMTTIAAEFARLWRIRDFLFWKQVADTVSIVAEPLIVVAILFFLAMLAFRTIKTEAGDQRRRLLVLSVGALVGLSPMLILAIRSFVRGCAPFDGIPGVVALFASLAVPLFPAALTYAVVARRMLSLRTGMRESLKYLLLRRGLQLARVAVAAAAALACVLMANLPGYTPWDLLRAAAVTGCLLLLLRDDFATMVFARVDHGLFGLEAAREAAMRMVPQEMQGAHSLQDLSSRLDNQLAPAFGARHASLLLLDAAKAVWTPAGSPPASKTLPATEALQQALQDDKPLVVYAEERKIQNHAIAEAERDALDSLDAQVLTPLKSGGQNFGILVLSAKWTGEPYAHSDLESLHAIAPQIGLSVENCRLVETLASEIEERERVNVAKAAAERANETKRSFLANMSHELRTPLNAILGYSEMLQEESEALGVPELCGDLRKINRSARHLLELINAVLDVSKIEAGKMELYVEEFPVQDLVDDVVTMTLPLVESKNNRIEVENRCGGIQIHADLLKLRQCLVNLIGNAAKFTDGGKVTLRVETRAAGRIAFSVADTGIGMTPPQLERIFEAFTQADASVTRRFGGTGLGLTIARHFCQMMGGRLDVSSKFGEGSVFTIEIPRDCRESESQDSNVGDDSNEGKLEYAKNTHG
jgi:signal transduction histidine kinase